MSDVDLTNLSREQMRHYLNTACPKHGMAEREYSRDSDGEWTGDYYCTVVGCDWIALVGWGVTNEA